MKYLVVADLHYTLKQLDWVNLAAQDFDLVIIAGDLLDIASVVELDVQILVVMKYLKQIQPRTRLLTCSGNHDGDERNSGDESVAQWMQEARADGVLVDGDWFERDGCLFTICPWWDGPQTKAEVAALLQRDSLRPKNHWVWVYHAPPNGSPVSWTGKKYFGDSDLAGWIDQYRPQMVLSGHVHDAPFRKDGSWVDRIGSTWVFNMGRQIGPSPTHIIIDTESATASWYSLAGNEQIHLDRDLLKESI
ncbi:MAG: metallophosphoesterase [Verrucomicrobiota bacterium]